jgi:hypothetical protein
LELATVTRQNGFASGMFIRPAKLVLYDQPKKMDLPNIASTQIFITDKKKGVKTERFH